MLGQYESYDPLAFESSIYEPTSGIAISDYPSEARYIPIYEQEAASIDTQVAAESSGGFFDTIKSAITALSPLATSIIRATTTPGTPATPVATTPTIFTTTPTGQAAGLGSLISNPLILAGGGLLAFLLLRKRGGRKRR